MRTAFLICGIVYLCSAQWIAAQNLSDSPVAVSFYQLGYKPNKQAQHLFNKGLKQLKRHKFETAVPLLKRATEMDPRYWAAENNLGCAYLKLAQPQQAEQAFRRAVEIDPQNSIGFTNLSVAAVNLNDYREAEQFARQALRLNPEQIEAKGLLGLSEAGQGNWTPEARRLLEEGQGFISGSKRLLRSWPRSNAEGPTLLVVQSNLR